MISDANGSQSNIRITNVIVILSNGEGQVVITARLIYFIKKLFWYVGTK